MFSLEKCLHLEFLSLSKGGYLDVKWSDFIERFCEKLEIFVANEFRPFKQGCLKQILQLENLKGKSSFDFVSTYKL